MSWHKVRAKVRPSRSVRGPYDQGPPLPLGDALLAYFWYRDVDVWRQPGRPYANLLWAAIYCYRREGT